MVQHLKTRIVKSITKRYNDSTYSKVITLLSLVTFGLLLLVLSLYFYTRIQEKQIFKSSRELFSNEINSLLKLNAEPYTSVINDATYWDEFVDFTKTKDVTWFNTSVANIIDTYKVEYLCAYSIDGSFITKVSTLKIKTKDFIPDAALKRIREKKVDKFYLKIPEGIVEVYGATIHPSNDPYKNKTQPSGYFFIARLLDAEYFANIEEISSSKIKFYEGNEKARKTVFTVIPLKDYEGKTISSLYFKRAYDIDFSITKRILLITALALLLSWIVYYYYANLWSRLPISFIKKILVNGDPSAIASLKNIRGEFRYIGKLFEENKVKTEQLAIAKSKAEESDKLKSAFLMNLSHEIRTPMNAILGFTDMLSNPTFSDAEKEEFITIIKQSGKNLIDIIDDLVEMSKIDSNIVKPNIYAVDLDELVQSTFNSCKGILHNEAVDFKLITPEKPARKKILTDGTKLREVIANLINNAFKFTEEGSVTLEYAVNEVDNKIVFTVKDSGIGIPEEFQSSVFKRFSKINAKGISANEGLGLGLAISKAYVAMLGGEIDFKSQLGIGTTFTFSILLHYDESDDVEVSEESKITVPIDMGSEKIILVAEDDNINFILIEKLLKMHGFKIIRAKDGAEAVQLCKENNEIDLVFMDIKMPNLNGYEAFQKIREFNTEIPIIAQTSYSFSEEIDRIKEIGFDDYLSKPLDKVKIAAILKKYFENPEK
ncbi:transmembrane sensor hybrid histidine kinase [Flavobacterium cauense R2A-7]|uniref:histidine kinase n=1 Tax=Flavobacterium cauense R2A-7 TaxID=1341154 RepID=V6S1Q5_9FLAO|nr:transmembrane sensor hybrid histidine kinase [Flavobacterium cauense R2A-7]TWI10710.1 signal transduction histidine kinase [Flavobacterium cauense R2A-7]